MASLNCSDILRSLVAGRETAAMGLDLGRNVPATGLTVRGGADTKSGAAETKSSKSSKSDLGSIEV